ncbi:putative polynucleotide adenylyltransferase [Helianthus debilis subsp. tardiflorus]
MAYVIDHNNPTGRPVLVPNYSSLNLINPNFPHNPHHFHHQVLVPVQFSLNPALVAQIELHRSISLQQFMNDEGLVPSREEEQRRYNVIRKLKEIAIKWIKRVAYLRRLPQDHVRVASATILTYGSYGLGVHNAESDIDALCVGPWFASLTEDFFIVLHDILAKRVEVSDIQCVKDAKVPLMRFKFEGISVDLPYAQLQVTTVPENVDILNPLFLNGIDETSWKSLSGVRANNSILQLVPDVKIFQQLLRCVKLWAKRRGLYGNLFGLLGGVHLAVLTAFVCQRNPKVSLAGLVSIFFKTFASWPWPAPVLLQQGIMMPRHHSETRSLMPIQLPSSPHEYCHSNVTTSTFMKISTEFRRGYRHTQDLLKSQFDWRKLFEQYPYSKIYQHFLKICLSTSNESELGDWIGWVKSRFRGLLVKLEEVHVFYDPNPTEYFDTTIQDPNVVFYWGLVLGKNKSINLDSIQDGFKKNLDMGPKSLTGNITLSIIQSSQLPKNMQLVDTQPMVSNPGQMVPMYSNPVPHGFVGYFGPVHPGFGPMN